MTQRQAYDWQGKLQQMPQPAKAKRIACYQSDSIELWRHNGKPRLFAVVYGLQVKERLTYVQAAHELGECIMHAIACESE